MTAHAQRRSGNNVHPSMTARRALGMVLSTVAALATVLWAPPGPARLVSAGFLFLVAPGIGLRPLWRGRQELWWQLAGVFALSVTADIIVAQVVTYAAGFYWRPCAVLLTGVAISGAAVQIALAKKPRTGGGNTRG